MPQFAGERILDLRGGKGVAVGRWRRRLDFQPKAYLMSISGNLGSAAWSPNPLFPSVFTFADFHSFFQSAINKGENRDRKRDLGTLVRCAS